MTILQRKLELIDAEEESDADSFNQDSENASVDGANFQTTKVQIDAATGTSFDTKIEKLIADAQKLAEEAAEVSIEDEATLPVDHFPPTARNRALLEELFQLMNQSKFPIHHEYKALLFVALRAEIFVYVAGR